MFPSVSEAFWDWDSMANLSLVKKKVDDFEVVEDPIVEAKFRGVFQPMPPQKLLIKPEGQRHWKFWDLWTTQFLKPDAIVMDCNNVLFRIVSKENWAGAGYFHYELAEGVRGE